MGNVLGLALLDVLRDNEDLWDGDADGLQRRRRVHTRCGRANRPLGVWELMIRANLQTDVRMPSARCEAGHAPPALFRARRGEQRCPGAHSS